MKIVITASLPTIESEIDPRFGRGAYLLVVDPATLEYQAHPNPGINASGGAGVQAAQFVIEQNADAVISGDFGPNAFAALNAANIQMFLLGTTRTVRQAITRFNSGQLESTGAPTRQGTHH